jgi:hypothetical protein
MDAQALHKVTQLWPRLLAKTNANKGEEWAYITIVSFFIWLAR